MADRFIEKFSNELRALCERHEVALSASSGGRLELFDLSHATVPILSLVKDYTNRDSCPKRKGGCAVEVVTNGFFKHVFIDGHRIPQVLEVALDRKEGGEFSPEVSIRLCASTVLIRKVDDEEFDRLGK